MGTPRSYKNMKEFEREEIDPHKKLGWSLEDLYQEATFKANDDGSQDNGVQELDFG